MEVFGKYRMKAKRGNKKLMLTDIVSALTNTYATVGKEAAKIVSESLTGALTAITPGDDKADGSPPAYLQYILFDKNMNYVDQRFGFDRIDPSAGFTGPDATATGFDKMEMDVAIDQEGILMVYVSSESPDAEVWFDDFSLMHTTDYVARAIDYYPFGMEMAKVDEDPNLVYRFGYQGQYAEKDEETDFNSFALRQYDARIGRFTTVDPYGQFFSPYVGMGNSPVNVVDPTGGWSWVMAGIGAAVGAGIGYAASDGDWRAALAGGLTGAVIGGASFSGNTKTTDFAGEINKFASVTEYTFNPGVLTASLNAGVRLLQNGGRPKQIDWTKPGRMDALKKWRKWVNKDKGRIMTLAEMSDQRSWVKATSVPWWKGLGGFTDTRKLTLSWNGGTATIRILSGQGSWNNANWNTINYVETDGLNIHFYRYGSNGPDLPKFNSSRVLITFSDDITMDKWLGL